MKESLRRLAIATSLLLVVSYLAVACSRDGAPSETLYGARGVPYASGWRCTVEEHKSPTYYVKKTECWK